ncbi:unnamed protein product [Rangifer tarandus platyrhynchus]|uniref:Uncharacterized protein n=1 Tax=Rangifer tarandus platyrhynchus TaxID=3082113 RepID=A0ABN8YAZ0_RANTA|nr:unnamed protein product [Rangifer tarandus platyrhynchus]
MEEFLFFLHCSRGCGIVTAAGNSGVAEWGLDMGGWAVFSLMAELGPGQHKELAVWRCPLTSALSGCCSPAWVGFGAGPGRLLCSTSRWVLMTFLVTIFQGGHRISIINY